MARKHVPTTNVPDPSPFRLRTQDAAAPDKDPLLHIYGRNGIVCATEGRGHPTPRNADPLLIVLEASEGFIPLWAKGTTLRWRFQERSMSQLENPVAARAAIKDLLGRAIVAWGDAAPVKFTEQSDTWDFEIVARASDECGTSGCVLASAFFPDAGRHQLVLYPKLFKQSAEEQLDTMIHEIGHVFGLRHFFAQLRETPWASQVFGTHSPFSIMNYGAQSVFTEADKADLRRLYQLAWRGEISHVNGTPIRFVHPFHASAEVVTPRSVMPLRSALLAGPACPTCGCLAG